MTAFRDDVSDYEDITSAMAEHAGNAEQSAKNTIDALEKTCDNYRSVSANLQAIARVLSNPLSLTAATLEHFERKESATAH